MTTSNFVGSAQFVVERILTRINTDDYQDQTCQNIASHGVRLTRNAHVNTIKVLN